MEIASHKIPSLREIYLKGRGTWYHGDLRPLVRTNTVQRGAARDRNMVVRELHMHPWPCSAALRS